MRTVSPDPKQSSNRMKYLICLLVIVLLDGCTQNNPPTAPDAQSWFYLDFTGYGETMGPGYLKVFSDSSWEEYYGIDTVNGTGYVSILSSDSSLMFYTQTTGQYSGYRIPGQDPVIFDAPLPFLPTRWPSNTTFARTATFTLMGLSVAVTDFYTLVDTGGLVTPVGTFSPVPHFEDDTYLEASDGETGYASQDLWTARGPGVVLTAQQGQPAAYFIRGYVNGKAWGSALPSWNAVAGGRSPDVGLRGLLRILRTGSSGLYAGRTSTFLPKPKPNP
jgi:hypothetical protein